MSSFITAQLCGNWQDFESQSLVINIVSGVVSIAACLLTVAVIDKIGRKPILLIGSAGMAVTLFAMVYAFSHGSLDASGNLVLSRDLGSVAVVAANLYVIFFNFSWGPVMWVMLGEMFPNPCGSGLPCAACFNGSRTSSSRSASRSWRRTWA